MHTYISFNIYIPIHANAYMYMHVYACLHILANGEGAREINQKIN